MVDFEEDTYKYLAGTRPESGELAIKGRYEDFEKHLCLPLMEEDERQEFAKQVQKEAVIASLKGQDDVRLECHVMRGNRENREHLNIICLERKDGRACKVLFIRQNITEVKEKELHIQAEISLASRKERQYRIAVTSNAFSTFEFNLTKDLIEQDIICVMNGRQLSLLERAGLKAPLKNGMNAHIAKPLDMEVFIGVLKQYLK